jgi:hypothetical protein
MVSRLSIGLAIILGCYRPAAAEPVTIAFAGHFNLVESFWTVPPSEIFGRPVLPGDAFSGTFTYDPARPTEPFLGPDDRTVSFRGAPYGMSVTAGGQTLRRGSLSMRVARDFISVGSFGPVDGSTRYDHYFLLGLGGLQLTDFSTPTPDVLLGSFGQGFNLFLAELWPYQTEDSDDAFVRASGLLTSLTLADAPAPVPEPGTIVLWSIGLATTGWRARRKLFGGQ